MSKRRRIYFIIRRYNSEKGLQSSAVSIYLIYWLLRFVRSIRKGKAMNALNTRKGLLQLGSTEKNEWLPLRKNRYRIHYVFRSFNQTLGQNLPLCGCVKGWGRSRHTEKRGRGLTTVFSLYVQQLKKRFFLELSRAYRWIAGDPDGMGKTASSDQ